jgi:hypothetical protein
MDPGFTVELGMLVRITGPDVPCHLQDAIGTVVRIDEVGDLDVALSNGNVVHSVHIEEIDAP